MSDHIAATARAPARAGALERGCTTGALLLAGVTAAIAASLIARDDGVSDRWRAVIVLWGVAPSFVAWEVVHARRLAGARLPVLWLAIFPAALAALFSYLVLAPSLVLVVVAAVRASAAGMPRRLATALRAVAGGVLFAAGWGAGFRALFMSEDARCHTTATSSSCASDVVTLPEVAIALALLGGGIAAALVLTRER